MSRHFRSLHLGILTGVVGLAIAASAEAQAPRSRVDVPATPGMPSFKDPKTGRVWTPANVGGVGGPNTPADRAFDPRAQATVIEGTVIQTPPITELGTVPITVGPTVPIVNFSDTTLQSVPGQRWQMMLYLNNNSAQTVSPVLLCRFTNGSQLVERTRAVLPPVAGGVRVGFTIYGPKSDLFVDNSSCEVEQP